MGVITGEIRCKRCFKTFEWYCVIHNSAENLDEITKGKVAARLIESRENGEPKVVQARCKHCSETNRIEYRA
jgi:hypothetical protein